MVVPTPEQVPSDSAEVRDAGPSTNRTMSWSLDDLTFDPDDPNYKHQETLHAVFKAYNELPPGWSRNLDAASGPPYVHEDGRTSYKNPAREKIREILDRAEQESLKDANTKCQKPSQQSQRRLLKKYRMMIKNGVPLGAVEATARREGVDPALISKSDAPAEPSPSPSSGRAGEANANLKKYRMMIKSGVPIGAVEATARREGVDPALITGSGSPITKHELFHARKSDRGEDQVEFIADLKGSSKGTHIATLVRKMVQTVRKRGGGTNLSARGSFLTVDSKDLYNALGAFRGVQRARDMFNSTCHPDSPMTESEIRAKRKPFLEHLSSLGIRAPTSKDERADIEGLDDLIALIEMQHQGEISSITDNIDVSMYDFDSLAELYKPGTQVVGKNVFAAGVDMLAEVSWSRYEQGKTLFGVSRYFKVCFQFVVAVGEHFTLCEFVEGMENFEGRRNIKGLPFVPLSAFDEDAAEQMMVSFRQRGEMYSRCATSAQFLAYSKGSFYAKGGRGGREPQTAALRTHGRVMVDTQGGYEAGHSLSMGYEPMVLGIKYKYKEYNLLMRLRSQASGGSSSGGASPAGASSGDEMILFDTVPTDYLEMCWPAAVGFSFTSKTWGDVLIDGLSQVQFQEEVFESLVLPKARKRMVKALVRGSSDGFNDIVSGKGEGSVFLLYGPPGVGKTLTAEAISEMLHRPLYTVSLGQLGTTAAELETKLGEILDLCGKWDALILLDEADIFLEKRTSGGSLERNAMVSVMLRLVEYFKGVLFLTSNRVDSLDPAFKTRITLALRYDQLDQAARNQVWTNLLTASGLGESVKESLIDCSKLAEHELNGREIKNAIRLAMALAKEDSKPLTQEIILETVEILLDFNGKMNSAEAY